MVKIRGQHCGDIEVSGYLTNETGPVPLVLDLRLAHDRVGSSTDPTLTGHLLPNTVSFMPAIASTSGRLHSEFVRLLSLQAHRETDRFFADTGVQLAQTNRGMFHYLRAVLSAQLKKKSWPGSRQGGSFTYYA